VTCFRKLAYPPGRLTATSFDIDASRARILCKLSKRAKDWTYRKLWCMFASVRRNPLPYMTLRLRALESPFFGFFIEGSCER
jgi:hypothetical protein